MITKWKIMMVQLFIFHHNKEQHELLVRRFKKALDHKSEQAQLDAVTIELGKIFLEFLEFLDFHHFELSNKTAMGALLKKLVIEEAKTQRIAERAKKLLAEKKRR